MTRTVFFDTETTGLHVHLGDGPFAFVIMEEDESYQYYEMKVDPYTRRIIADSEALDAARKVLSDPTITKVGANLKFDIGMMEYYWGIETRGPLHDVLVMSHVCKSDEHKHALKPLAKKHLNFWDEDEKDLQKAVVSCRRYAKSQEWMIAEDVQADYWLPRLVARCSPEMVEKYPNLATLCEIYCVRDGLRTLGLYEFYRRVLEKEQVEKVYERERKLFPIVYDMESRGVRTDIEVAKAESKACHEKLSSLTSEIESVFGKFNKKVPDGRIRRYLFGDAKGCLSLFPDPHRKTKTGMPQVTKEVLESLEDQVPVLRSIRDYKKHLQAATAYFDNYVKYAVLDTGGNKRAPEYVIHANFKQAGPKTGRFSCTSPALQIVPKRAPAGDIMARVRCPFGPRRGNIWFHRDYKAIEARIYADEANETDMLKIFADGGDVYRVLVQRVQEMVPDIDLSAKYAFADSGGKPGTGARQICKNNHLGWQYGEGKDKLARAMFLEGKIAEKVINALKVAFPRGMPFMREMQRVAKKLGYILNRYGRKTPIPPPLWDGSKMIDFSYKAVNYLIQPTAADIMKEAMIVCYDYLLFLQKRGYEIYMVMTIHDELVFEARKCDLTAEVVRETGRLMSSVTKGIFNKVEFPTDASITRERWDIPEEIKL